jgi:hypothetical protein
MSTTSSPLPMLVAGIFLTAVLCTLLAKDGWLVWIPVLLALGVFAAVGAKFGRL